MKKIKRKVFFTISLILCAVAGTSLNIKNKDKNDKISCTANARIHSGNNVLNASFNYMLSAGSGFVNINGYVSDGLSNKTKVNIKKSFTYYKDGSGYVFKQNPDIITEQNEIYKDTLNTLLPDFYFKNKPLYNRLNIEELKPGVWVFSTSRTPYFICIDY